MNDAELDAVAARPGLRRVAARWMYRVGRSRDLLWVLSAVIVALLVNRRYWLARDERLDERLRRLAEALHQPEMTDEELDARLRRIFAKQDTEGTEDGAT